MKTVRTPRLVSLASLFLASGAFALSTWTACQEHQPTAIDEVSGPAVQGERAETQGAAPSGGPSAAADSGTDANGASPAGSAAVRAAPASAPGPRAETTTARKPAASSDSVTTPPEVKRLVLASAVENREPVALGGDAKMGEPLTAFVELANPGSTPVEVVVTFEHSSGQKVGFVKLEVPAASPRYRTWARTQNIKKSGDWHAVVRLEDGTELAKESFTAAAPAVAPAAEPAAKTVAAPAAEPADEPTTKADVTPAS